MRISRTAVWICTALLAGPGLWNLPARADDHQNDNSQGNEELGTIPPDAAGTLQRGVPNSGHKAARTTNLTDHGGKILPVSNVYFIWWGSSFPSDAKAGLESIAQGMNGTGYLGIMQQYMRGSKISTAWVTSTNDTSAAPSHGPSVSTIVNEACKIINANHGTADTTALYTVVTSNFPHINYCAWHSHGMCNGTDIQVAYIPNATGVAGCDPGDLFKCNSYSQGTRSMADSFAHEFSETITDPDLNAWFDSSGAEIGDKCNFTYSACVNLKNGLWQLQEEWSNAISGCQQQ